MFDNLINRPRLLLIDGHALLYRAYHAFPPLTAPATGQLVNAAYGFSRILLKSIKDFQPKYIAIAFDTKGPTIRHELYDQYKAHRPPTPDDFIKQVPIAFELVKALNIPQFALSEYEADDVIGTITHLMSVNNDQKVLSTVISGDKDLLQLVDDHTHVWLPGSKWAKDTEYDKDKVITKMGVTPEQIAHLKALAGDASDNIPGIRGIGQKTASKLISQYQSIEKLYQTVDQLEYLTSSQLKAQHPTLASALLLEKLRSGRESAFLSLKLATIQTDAPINFVLSNCVLSQFDKTKVTDFFSKYGFQSLSKFLPADEFELSVQDALF